MLSSFHVSGQGTHGTEVAIWAQIAAEQIPAREYQISGRHRALVRAYRWRKCHSRENTVPPPSPKRVDLALAFNRRLKQLPSRSACPDKLHPEQLLTTPHAGSSSCTVSKCTSLRCYHSGQISHITLLLCFRIDFPITLHDGAFSLFLFLVT